MEKLSTQERSRLQDVEAKLHVVGMFFRGLILRSLTEEGPEGN